MPEQEACHILPRMNDEKFPPHIYSISDADFWSHLRAQKGSEPSVSLEEAIRLGRAGHQAKGYAKLAAFHRAARTGSWELAREAAQRAAQTSAAEIIETIDEFAGSLRHPQPRHTPTLPGARGDGSGVPHMESIIALVRPVTLHLIRTGDKRVRAFVADALRYCFRHRRTLSEGGGYPLNTMLPAHDQFHFFWWSYLALIRTGRIPTNAAEAAMKLIMGLGRSMQRQTERYIVHNIFTAACYGMFFLGRTMKEFREAGAWEEHSLACLDLDFDRSFFTDGGHLERNWGYGCYTLGRLNHVWEFANRTGGMRGREAHFSEGLRRAYRFYAYTLDPNDISPGFGDEGLKPLGHVLDEALEGDLFPGGIRRDLGVDRSASLLMEGSGIAVMRNGSKPVSTYANVTFGDHAGWHSHLDLLSMNLRSMGEILIEEAPRFGPYEHPMDLLWRAPEAHNQLLVDSFLYDSRPCVGEEVAWHTDEHLDYFSACHRAYRQIPPQGHRDFKHSGDLLVRRTIVFVKEPGYLLVLDSVRDEVSEAFNRATSAYWHSPNRFEVVGPSSARTGGRRACLMAWAYPESIQRIETGVDFAPEDLPDGHAPLRNQWYRLRARTWMPTSHDGCLGFATVLFPFRGRRPEVTVRTAKLTGRVRYRAEAFEVTTPAGRDTFVLNPEGMPGLCVRGRPVNARARVKLASLRRAIEVK